jgi:hypothetical protein
MAPNGASPPRTRLLAGPSGKWLLTSDEEKAACEDPFYPDICNHTQGVAALTSGFQLDFRRFAFYFDPGAKGL